MPKKECKRKIEKTIIEKICYNCFYFSSEYYDEEYEMSVCINYRSHKYCMQSTSVNKCDFFKFMPIIAGR